MLNVNDITITSLDIISAYSLAGVPRFILDELQDAQISNTQEKEDIVGKAGRKLNSLKRNKAATISGTNGMLSAGLLEAQTGSNFERKASTPVEWSETLVITDDTATTSYKAVGTVGAEITALYKKDAVGAAEEKLEQDAVAAEGKFAYDPSTKQLTFATGAYEDGTEIIVFYTRNISGDVLNNDSEKYSEKLRLIIDATAEDKCSNVYHLQIEFPKADFNGDFDIQMGDSQAVHAFEAESLVNTASCGGSARGGNLWTWTIFGENAGDASDVYNVAYKVTGQVPSSYVLPAGDVNVAPGSSVEVAATPSTMTGSYNGQAGTFTFAGWTAPAGVTVSNDAFTMPAQNVTFTGVWTFTQG